MIFPADPFERAKWVAILAVQMTELKGLNLNPRYNIREAADLVEMAEIEILRRIALDPT